MPEEYQDLQVDLVVTGASELLTCSRDAPDLIGRIRGGGVAINDGRIRAVGDVSNFRPDRIVDARGGVVMPGFVDAHTHVVFGGTRVDEYAARVAGQAPPENAPRGITGSVATSRAASREELFSESVSRVQEMIRHGTTTLESKSGYGLDVEHELRILETNQRLQDALPASIISTYLGAHAIPEGVPGDVYTDQIVELIPEISRRGLARFCDVYCDEGYFDLKQTERILNAGLNARLRPKLHLDAYSHTGAASLAADVGAVSVDHLNYTTDEELATLARAGVAGVYMPCLEYAVAHPRPLDPRRLVAAGMELALATDVCPGNWTVNMQLAIAMACRTGCLSVARALRAATYGAARSLGIGDNTGSLAPGMQADLIVLNIPQHEDIAYRIGHNAVSTVVMQGVVIQEHAA